ncbi:hypothetical protein ACFP2F_20170 [Hymenobacter artigasi]|uniref:Translation initiation factor 2 n=1 Tax=Hymenobacter artigasi TaxID=2719616 RepID=A0ABX1HMS5_9BACT|nr:hypothetical protein [Hymenobacter artigasi]NKI91554.1 hypothetical protein [Hymenobacter artigasi]
MKNFFPPFAKLVALAACALTLGSCSRSEYAMLPKGSSYHGVTRVATPVPAATPETAVMPAAEPVATVAPAAVATVQPAIPAAVAAAPAAKTTARVATPAAAVQAPMAVVAAPAPKLNLVQRMALSKVTRKMDKLMQKSGSVRQHDNTASTSSTAAISGNLRIGIILLLVGLLVGLLNGLIGTIIAIIGLIFIILWLLDQM